MKAGPGRPPGAENKLTRNIKDCLSQAFDGLGGVEGLIEWAQKSDKNRGVFYTAWGRLAPREVLANVQGRLDVVIRNEAANESAE